VQQDKKRCLAFRLFTAAEDFSGHGFGSCCYFDLMSSLITAFLDVFTKYFQRFIKLIFIGLLAFGPQPAFVLYSRHSNNLDGHCESSSFWVSFTL